MLSMSCHCGTVRIEVARRPRSITECNCSVCRRYAARWAYYRRESVKVMAPARALQCYSRGRALYFDHCRRCGCVMQWRLKPARSAANRLAVNMRMLDDPGALANIKVLRFDGAVSWKDVGTHTLKQPWW